MELQISLGLFILTLLVTPVADEPVTYIIAFDTNGNIKIDEKVNYIIDIDDNKSTLNYRFHIGGGTECYEVDSNLNTIHSSVITYIYSHNEIEEYFKVEKYLPKCE